jgi:hypothetical protein
MNDVRGLLLAVVLVAMMTAAVVYGFYRRGGPHTVRYFYASYAATGCSSPRGRENWSPTVRCAMGYSAVSPAQWFSESDSSATSGGFGLGLRRARVNGKCQTQP